jgi:hypothetical protein
MFFVKLARVSLEGTPTPKEDLIGDPCTLEGSNIGSTSCQRVCEMETPKNKILAKKGVVAYCERRRQNKRPKEFASADFVPWGCKALSIILCSSLPFCCRKLSTSNSVVK